MNVLMVVLSVGAGVVQGEDTAEIYDDRISGIVPAPSGVDSVPSVPTRQIVTEKKPDIALKSASFSASRAKAGLVVNLTGATLLVLGTGLAIADYHNASTAGNLFGAGGVLMLTGPVLACFSADRSAALSKKAQLRVKKPRTWSTMWGGWGFLTGAVLCTGIGYTFALVAHGANNPVSNAGVGLGALFLAAGEIQLFRSSIASMQYATDVEQNIGKPASVTFDISPVILTQGGGGCIVSMQF